MDLPKLDNRLCLMSVLRGASGGVMVWRDILLAHSGPHCTNLALFT